MNFLNVFLCVSSGSNVYISLCLEVLRSVWSLCFVNIMSLWVPIKPPLVNQVHMKDSNWSGMFFLQNLKDFALGIIVCVRNSGKTQDVVGSLVWKQLWRRVLKTFLSEVVCSWVGLQGCFSSLVTHLTWLKKVGVFLKVECVGYMYIIYEIWVL